MCQTDHPVRDQDRGVRQRQICGYPFRDRFQADDGCGRSKIPPVSSYRQKNRDRIVRAGRKNNAQGKKR